MPGVRQTNSGVVQTSGGVAQTAVQTQPSSGVSYWDMESGSGDLTDQWGSNTGTVNGPSFDSNTAQAGTYSLSFDGSNDDVDMGDVADLEPGTGAMSWSFWANSSDPHPNDTRGNMVEKGAFNNGGYNFVADGSSEIEMNLRDNGGNDIRPVSTNDISWNGTWQHICGTYNGTDAAELYINGSSAGTDSNASFGGMSTGDQFILGVRDGVGRYFGGNIDEVKVYDKELTATEVSDLYNNGSI